MASQFASRIDVKFLTGLAPAVPLHLRAAQAHIVEKTAEYLPVALEYAAINTPLRIAHFLAQIAHESDGFATTEEYASGRAYEWRHDLGNIHKGDGPRYKGRGLIQLTGRKNYIAFTLWLRSIRPDCPDFEARPELAAMFPASVWTAAWYWNNRKINRVADTDNLDAVTRAINGGTNGLTARKAYLVKAKTMIEVVQGQEALSARGFYHGQIDGIPGPATRDAVYRFQQHNSLNPDGIIGPKTAAVLFADSGGLAA